MLVWVYTCQNATLLEITCRSSVTNEVEASQMDLHVKHLLKYSAKFSSAVL